MTSDRDGGAVAWLIHWPCAFGGPAVVFDNPLSNSELTLSLKHRSIEVTPLYTSAQLDRLRGELEELRTLNAINETGCNDAMDRMEQATALIPPLTETIASLRAANEALRIEVMDLRDERLRLLRDKFTALADLEKAAKPLRSVHQCEKHKGLPITITAYAAPVIASYCPNCEEITSTGGEGNV